MFRPFYSPNVLIVVDSYDQSDRAGLPECAKSQLQIKLSFSIGHSLVLLQKPKKHPPGSKEGERLSGSGRISLMDREDPQTGSEGCRGGLCSKSGRQRWMDRRCTWAGDDCRSDSGDTEEKKTVFLKPNLLDVS